MCCFYVTNVCLESSRQDIALSNIHTQIEMTFGVSFEREAEVSIWFPRSVASGEGGIDGSGKKGKGGAML